MIRPGRVMIALFVLFFLSGCSATSPGLNKIAPLPGDFSCRVAVVPFIDHGQYPRGAQLFHAVFSSELVSSAAFRLVQEGDLFDIYRQFCIYPTREPDQEQLRMIGSRLGVQIFIGGEILRMIEKKNGRDIVTEMTVALRIYDGKSGKILWNTYHKRRGTDYQIVLHFGKINTITGLARNVSKEIIKLWLDQGMAQCSK